MAQRKNTNKEESALVKFAKDVRVRLFLGLIISGFATLLLLSFVSYFFTWKIDQSFEWENIISSTEIQVENWAGKIGARMSNSCINNGFGIAAFFIPLYLFIIGLRLLKVKLMKATKAFFFCLISLILFSILLGYISYFSDTLNVYLGSGLGGSYGLYVSKWMIALLGKQGAGILFFILLFSYLFGYSSSFAKFITKKFTKAKTRTIEFGHNHTSEKSTELSNNQAIPQPKQPIITSEIETQQPPLNEEIPISIEEKLPEPEFEISSQETESKTEEIVPEVELSVNEPPTEDKEKLPSELCVEKYGEYDPTLDLPHYKLPTIDLLEEYSAVNSQVTDEELIANKNKIIETLRNYNIEITKIKVSIGPTVTLYEIVPAPGIRISKIKNLEDDIMMSLKAEGIRIIAPMPGKGTVGIEVPNIKPQIVSMRSLIASKKFQESDMELAVAMGKTITGETYIFDLTKMPHLLVAGATGQGKSVGLNAIVTSLLYKKHPSQLKFVLIDPKKVELTLYSKIERHFLAKLPGDENEAIVIDPKAVVNTLNSLIIEMESRYMLLKDAGERTVKGYNAKFTQRKLNPLKGHKYLPYIVVVIDEFADLISVAGKEVELPISRLAQLARAVGIHLVIATQRPSVNVITGTIKANFPARMAFKVVQKNDSRTILDESGADRLIGKGDMLLSTGNALLRLQCAFIDIPELERITDYIGSQQAYPTAFELPEYVGTEAESPFKNDIDSSKRDPKFEEAARLLVIHQQGSTSLLQRKLELGYNRAGRLMDQLENAGIVGPFEGSKARKVLFADEVSLEQHLKTLQ